MQTDFNTDILKDKTIKEVINNIIYFTDNSYIELIASYDFISEDTDIVMYYNQSRP